MQCCVFKCPFGFCATDGQRNVDLMNRWLLELLAGTLGKKQFRRRHIFTFLLLLSTKCKEATVQQTETTSATRGKADKMQPQPKNKRPNADMLRQMRGWGWGCLRQEHMFMRGRAASERQTLLRARTQPRTRVAAALG